MRGITMKEMATILDNRTETKLVRTNETYQKLQSILEAISSQNVQEIGSLMDNLDCLLFKIDGLAIKNKLVKLFDYELSWAEEKINSVIRKDFRTLLHVLRSFTLTSKEDSLPFNPWYCEVREFNLQSVHFVPLEAVNGLPNEVLGLTNVGNYLSSWIYYEEAPTDYSKFKVTHFVKSNGNIYCVPGCCADNLNLSVEDVPVYAKYGTDITLGHIAAYYAYTGQLVNFEIADEDNKIEIVEEKKMEKPITKTEQTNMELMYSSIYKQHEDEDPYAEFARLKRLFKSLKDELERNDIYVVLEFKNDEGSLYKKRAFQLMEVKLNSILVMFGRNTMISLSYTMGLEVLLNKQIVSIQLFKQPK